MLLRYALQRGTPALLFPDEVAALAQLPAAGAEAGFGFELSYEQKCHLDAIADAA